MTRIAQAGVRMATAMVVLALVAAGSAHAQQPTPPRPGQRTPSPRRQETIEIRGQVPTPQVVTVRPREAPAYSRRVLVPAFFDRDFWPSILPPLQIVSPGGTGSATLLADSLPRSVPGSSADSTRRPQPAAPRPPSGMPPAPQRQ